MKGSTCITHELGSHKVRNTGGKRPSGVRRQLRHLERKSGKHLAELRARVDERQALPVHQLERRRRIDRVHVVADIAVRRDARPRAVVRVARRAARPRPPASSRDPRASGCGNGSPTCRRSPRSAIGTPRGRRAESTRCPSSAAPSSMLWRRPCSSGTSMRVTQHGLTWMWNGWSAPFVVI